MSRDRDTLAGEKTTNGLGGSMQKERQHWSTPVRDFTEISDLYGPFDLDAAASISNTRCARYITERNNAFETPWAGTRVWCNPPHRDPGPWIERAEEQLLAGECERVVMLFHAGTDTAWFRRVVSRAWGVRVGETIFRRQLEMTDDCPWLIHLWHRRIQFVPPKGVKPSSNPRSSVVLVGRIAHERDELMRRASPAPRLRYAAERLKAVRSDVFLDAGEGFLSGVEWAVRTLGELSSEEEGESDD